ncbi:hypothetical protein RRF57_003759 [Xylaria bambusicola]|uniref:Uncharacterized protein n=1 Tax=Xylaria bambusicola TaxID=326684 RepID=A0AAN7U9G5_9PEZI
MSTFFLQAFLPFLEGWLYVAGASVEVVRGCKTGILRRREYLEEEKEGKQLPSPGTKSEVDY